MDPSTWGPHLWIGLHYIALGYPETPSISDKMNYKFFFENLDKVLPCGKCADHYKENANTVPVDNYLETPAKLFEWTVLMHNAVNKILGKPSMTLDEAKTIYSPKHTEPFVCSPVGREDHTLTFFISFLVVVLLIIGCVVLRKEFIKKG